MGPSMRLDNQGAVLCGAACQLGAELQGRSFCVVTCTRMALLVTQLPSGHLQALVSNASFVILHPQGTHWFAKFSLVGMVP